MHSTKVIHVCVGASPHTIRWLALTQDSVEHHLVSLGHPLTDLKELAESVTFVKSTHHPNQPLNQLLHQTRWVHLIRKKARSLAGPVILHAHGCYRPALAAKLSRVPFVATVHGSEVLREGPLVQKISVAHNLRSAIRVSVSSDSTERCLRDTWGLKAPRIHCSSLGFSDNIFKLTHQQLPLSTDLKIVSVRRFLPPYRIIEIIDAFNNLRNQGFSATLSLVSGIVDGNEPYRKEVERAVEKSPYSTDIQVYANALSPTELAAIIQRSDVAVSMSRTDQLSTVLLEALGCGTGLLINNLAAYSPIKSFGGVEIVPDATSMEIANGLKRLKEKIKTSDISRQSINAGVTTINKQAKVGAEEFYRLALYAQQTPE